MNGEHNAYTSIIDDTSQPADPATSDGPCRLPMGPMHPDEVANDLRLSPAEKREILASWAFDVRAVPSAPALRQLDNGAVVRVDDVLRALKSLDEGEASSRASPHSVRSFAGLRIRAPGRLRSAERCSWSDDNDDDDPPPCPAMIVLPIGGPLSGGETVDPGLALAA
jgi:hypothetical protein